MIEENLDQIEGQPEPNSAGGSGGGAVTGVDCSDILCEPDRPGGWWWREDDMSPWREVTVGLISGGGDLRCWYPAMADYDDAPWRGQWVLKIQSGPPYGRCLKSVGAQ